ncbi:zeta toxin family protein [Halobacillus shinanisalinarum]|uniref:UDP-N-acetylglucosamine kinase n=1 Tax=Halobacillus shinanisalinarum TaxID=2932258 RepID=A0ABY4H196_9BACI|nr:zeta toxin family protein [Halobacillus shinanisalinarum]UOQ93951.1 zeta toxin family protein [Halobacillus shinanisalinarum]
MGYDKLPPMMYVFAGNNGSGKSTLRSLLIDKLGIDINIDPDSIARRLDPKAPETKQFAAGKAAVKLVYECIKEEKSFSIETTLAGKNAIHQMTKAKEEGFEITMFYVELSHVEQNIERVALRVKNGGHHIPTSDILKRDTTSKENLLRNLSLVDNLVVIDNSKSDGELVLEISNGRITFEVDDLPDWASPIKKTFNTTT